VVGQKLGGNQKPSALDNAALKKKDVRKCRAAFEGKETKLSRTLMTGYSVHAGGAKA